MKLPLTFKNTHLTTPQVYNELPSGNGEVDTSNLITKSKLNSRYWNRKKLNKLVNENSAEWNVSKGEFSLCIFNQKDKSSDKPMGFITFNLYSETFDENDFIDEAIKGEPENIERVIFSLEFIWVQEKFRGENGLVARHALNHLFEFIDQVEFNPEELSKDGFHLCFDSEIHSSGGDHACDAIQANFNWKIDNGEWDVNEFSYEYGW